MLWQKRVMYLSDHINVDLQCPKSINRLEAELEWSFLVQKIYNLYIAKDFDPRQPVPAAQADMG